MTNKPQTGYRFTGTLNNHTYKKDIEMKNIIFAFIIITPLLAQCDWNEDGTINVIDIVETVDCILNDCWSMDIHGCTDPEALNYNPGANIDDGSCEYEDALFEMVTIPAGEYTAGQWDAIISIDYDFEIMKYEVTNEQYLDYLQDAIETGEIWHEGGEAGSIMGNFNGQEYQFYDLVTPFNLSYGTIFWNGWYFDVETIELLNHPVVNITWFGANAFAQHYGMRLPKSDEWEKSARGMTGNTYSWGDDYPNCDLCNWQVNVCINGTTEVGLYGASIPFGLYDITGNVFEFTENVNENDQVIVKGGSWTVGSYTPMMTWYIGIVESVHSIENDIGFRCVRDID